LVMIFTILGFLSIDEIIMRKAHTRSWSLQKQLLTRKGDRFLDASVSIGRQSVATTDNYVGAVIDRPLILQQTQRKV